MNTRRFFLLASGAFIAHAADPASVVIRGKLSRTPAGAPALATGDGRFIPLTGDKDTVGVLRDKRLASGEIELRGRFTSPDLFTIDPIHTKAMHIHKDGKKLFITYWCEVCSIRTYTPGICWCCQEETALDLRESGKEDTQE